MRNAICAATQTSNVPTRVALLYISLLCGGAISTARKLCKANYQVVLYILK